MAKPKYFKEMEEIYGYRPIMYNEHESIVGLPELLSIASTASLPTSSAVAAVSESADPSRVSQENVHIVKKGLPWPFYQMMKMWMTQLFKS